MIKQIHFSFKVLILKIEKRAHELGKLQSLF